MFNQHRLLGEKRNDILIYEDKKMQRTSINGLKQWIYACQSLWIAGRRDSTLFGVVYLTTTTEFTSRACAVHCKALPVVVVVLKFPIVKERTVTIRHLGSATWSYWNDFYYTANMANASFALIYPSLSPNFSVCKCRTYNLCHIFTPHHLHVCDIFARSNFVQIHFFVQCLSPRIYSRRLLNCTDIYSRLCHVNTNTELLWFDPSGK